MSDDETQEPNDLSPVEKELSQLIDEWLAADRPERYEEDDKQWMEAAVEKARDHLLDLPEREEVIEEAARRMVRHREGQAIKRSNGELRKIATRGALPLGWGDGKNWRIMFFDLLHLPLSIGGKRVRLGIAGADDLEQWELENAREGDREQSLRIEARKGARLLAAWIRHQGQRVVEDLRIDEPPGNTAA
jgi:hypothetical protein